MKANNEKDKQLLLKKIKTAIAGQMSAAAAKQAAFYCDAFFKRVPLTELKQQTPDTVAAMVSSQT